MALNYLTSTKQIFKKQLMENFAMKLSEENALVSVIKETALNENIENEKAIVLTDYSSINNNVNELINDNTNGVDEQHFPYNMLGESLW